MSEQATFTLSVPGLDQEDVRAYDDLMREMGFDFREHLFQIMLLTFRQIRDRTKDREQLGFMSNGTFTPLDIHGMAMGNRADDAFEILPYPPVKPDVVIASTGSHG